MTISVGGASQMLGWLVRPEVVGSDGSVASWSNPDRPGYAYPEIAGYLLRILSQEEDCPVEIRDRIAVRLVTDLSPAGGVGRGGADYVFDSAMALAGLIAHGAAGGIVPDARAIDRLFDFITENVAARRAYRGVSEASAEHWSASYGCHLLKTAIALCDYNDLRPMSTTRAVVERLVADLIGLYDQGRFRVNDASSLTYLHSHCYAVEGLLVLQGRHYGAFTEEIRGSAQWLADIQQPEGGIRAFHDERQPFGPLRTDATSQAIRIWSLVDPLAFEQQINLGLGFVAAMTVPAGGLRYEPGSDDINTWATMFGLQAIRFARDGGDWQWIV